MDVLKFKCKNDFSYEGMPMSETEVSETSATIAFFAQSNWVKDKVYEGRYYDGGCMCPVPAYIVKGENGNHYYFSIYEAKPTYMLFSEHFSLIEQ